MSKEHAKIALRPLLSDKDGKRETENSLNKNRDLKGKF